MPPVYSEPALNIGERWLVVVDIHQEAWSIKRKNSKRLGYSKLKIWNSE